MKMKYSWQYFLLSTQILGSAGDREKRRLHLNLEARFGAMQGSPTGCQRFLNLVVSYIPTNWVETYSFLANTGQTIELIQPSGRTNSKFMDRLFQDIVNTSRPASFRQAELTVNIVNVPVDSGVWGILQLAPGVN